MTLKVWVAGSCPPELNSNYGLLTAITEGFEQALARSPDFSFGNAQLIPFSELHEAVSQGSPDILLLVGGLALPLIDLTGLANICQRKGIRMVFWSLEDPYEIDCLESQIHWFDMVCTSDYASSLVLPPSPPIRHLPLATRASQRPAELVGCEALGQWLFCGVPFRVRQHWIHAMSKAAFHGLVIGPGWHSLGSRIRVVNQRITPTVLHALYSLLPVTLMLGRDLNLHNVRNLSASTPGPRLFECAGVGGRQLVCGGGLEACMYYSPEEEILIAETPAEAIEKIQVLQQNKRMAASLSLNAWHRTQNEHLYYHRAKTMIGYLQDLALL